MAVNPTARIFTAPSDGRISPDMVAAYGRDGYLALENFASETKCDALRNRIDELIDGFDPAGLQTVFSTTEQSHAADRYFRESGDKISFFFEAGAFDAHGQLIRDKHHSLNKVGHALHDLDPVFDAFCRTPRLANVVHRLGVDNPGLVQSMYIFKPPHIGGEVTCHQDATFLHTTPQSCIGLWFALEDASIANGCLYTIPGGHKTGLKTRFHYDDGELVTDQLDPRPWPERGRIALEVKKGTLVVLHGLLPHLSGANSSDTSRHAFALHVVDRSAKWSEDNWLRRGSHMPVRGFV